MAKILRVVSEQLWFGTSGPSVAAESLRDGHHCGVGPYKAPQLSGRQEAGFSISCTGEQIIQAQGQTEAQVSVGCGFSYSVGNGAAGHGGFLEMHPWPRRAKKPDTHSCVHSRAVTSEQIASSVDGSDKHI